MQKFFSIALVLFLFVGITANAMRVTTDVATITIEADAGWSEITHESPMSNPGPCYFPGSSCIIVKTSVEFGLTGVSKMLYGPLNGMYVFTFRTTSVSYLNTTNGDESAYDGNNVKLPRGLKVYIDECEDYPELAGKSFSIGEPTTNSEGYFTVQIYFE